jgi:broad specificity phosphatase PhoE
MFFFLSHPEVVIDPAVPVPDWGLSPTGRARILAARGWPAGVRRVVTSHERKARETADILAGALGLTPGVIPGLEEIDRSATGYLPMAEHDATADACFAAPDASARGWERAVDAQARIVAALAPLIADGVPTLAVGHGGVGTLLWCALAGRPIARVHDQPAGGCFYIVRGRPPRPDGPWRRIEDRDAGQGAA